MTNYPSAPQSFVLSWEIPKSFQSTPTIRREGGGTEHRGNRSGVNQTTCTYNFQTKIDNLYHYTEIDFFLKSRDGKPFVFEGKLYKCLEYRWKRISPECWELSAQLDQVYRP